MQHIESRQRLQKKLEYVWLQAAIGGNLGGYRAAGVASRMSDPKMIRGIQEAVSIPV